MITRSTVSVKLQQSDNCQTCPSEVQEQVWKLSQLAAEGLEKGQFIFDSIPCDDMGLMQSAEEELVLGRSVSYCFLHLTLQEYLAALHWSRMGSEDIIRLVGGIRDITERNSGGMSQLFPLDTLVRHGIIKAAGYHWPALYFLAGLTKLTSVPVELLKKCLETADNALNYDLDRKKDIENYSLLLPVATAAYGARYNPYFFQLLFESQSCDLVTELFIGETSQPFYITNPLECFVTAWCVANSSPISRWSLLIHHFLTLKCFVDQLEKFACRSTKPKHGKIVGLFVDNSQSQSADYQCLIDLVPSLPILFPCLEYFGLGNLPVVDVTHFVPLFSSVHKLVSLKIFGTATVGDEGGLPAVTIPPQHCPSLSVVVLEDRASSFLFQSLVLPNINTLTALVSPMASSDVSIICTGLSQTTSLKGLVLEYSNLTTRQAIELARALEQNKSLEGVEITMTITDDGIRILRQVLSSHK